MIILWFRPCRWAQIDYSWQGICFVGNGVNGVGTGSSLQKITQQRYFLGHYRAAEVTSHPL